MPYKLVPVFFNGLNIIVLVHFNRLNSRTLASLVYSVMELNYSNLILFSFQTEVEFSFLLINEVIVLHYKC